VDPRLQNDQPPADGLSEQASGLGVVVVYEDFDAGRQARQTCDRLVQTLGPETLCTTRMWKSDVLRIPRLREIAARDASMAEIVMVASHGGLLPEHLRLWAELWLAFDHRSEVLVVLFDCSREHAKGVLTSLEDMAARAGLDFFAQPESNAAYRMNEPVEKTPGDLTTVAQPIAAPMPPASEEINPAHWGINE